MAKRGVKEFYKSKTFWFGALFVITAIANFFGFAEYEATPEVARVVNFLTGAFIIFLRFKTDKPISL